MIILLKRHAFLKPFVADLREFTVYYISAFVAVYSTVAIHAGSVYSLQCTYVCTYNTCTIYTYVVVTQ